MRSWAKPVRPGSDDEPLPVLRDLLAQLLEERRPDRPRPDDAHVAAHDVPQLRQLVQVREAQHAAEARHLRLRALRELVRRGTARAAPRRPGVSVRNLSIVKMRPARPTRAAVEHRRPR